MNQCTLTPLPPLLQVENYFLLGSLTRGESTTHAHRPTMHACTLLHSYVQDNISTYMEN